MSDCDNTLLKTAGSLGLMYLFSITPRLVCRAKRMPGKFYAHRGLHDLKRGIPENSMAAFRAACEHGFGIELDIQLTKDGQVLVTHDYDLKRICGVNRSVDECTYKELQEFSILGTTEKIPLLTDVLDMVNGQVPLIIEIKYKEIGSKICKKAAEILDHYTGVYCIESFHPLALLWYRKYRPHICRGQLGMNFHRDDGKFHPVYYFPRHLLLNFLTKPDFIAYDYHAKTAVSMNICRVLYGTPCFGWTLRSQKEVYASEHYFDYFIFEGFIPEES